MKFTRILAFMLSLISLLTMLSVPVLADDEEAKTSVVNGCRGIDSMVPYLGTLQLTENAQSVFLLEANTDTLMYAWNPDQQLPPAGMVKIMTALIAIEKGTLTDVVTVREDVINSVSKDARTTELQVGEVLTVEQLLYCVLVQGSNDAAAVLADHIGGSQEQFVVMMNDRATELGCRDTVFINVHGLHDDNQLTTVRDVARILDTAIENELFNTLFGTTHYTVEKTNKSEARDLESSNHMMHKEMYEIYYDERITGGRTGVNNMGLRCIATTSSQGNMDLICVVMGSESKINDRGIVEQIGGFKETKELLDKGFSGFKTAQILCRGQAVKQYQVRNGSADVVLATDESIHSVVPSNATPGSFNYQYVELNGAFNAPIKKGQKMAKVQVWNGNVCIAEADLYAMNDVAVNYQQIVVNERGKLSVGVTILIVILALIICATGGLFVVRIVNMRKSKTKKVRNRRHVRRIRGE